MDSEKNEINLKKATSILLIFSLVVLTVSIIFN